MARPNIQVSSDRENFISHVTTTMELFHSRHLSNSSRVNAPLPQPSSAQIRTWVRSTKWREPANLRKSYSIFTWTEALKQSTADGHPQNPQLDFRHWISDILFCKDLIIKRHLGLFKSEWKQSWFRPDISVVCPTPMENWKNQND